MYMHPLSRLWASFSSPLQAFLQEAYQEKVDLVSSLQVIGFVFDLDSALDFSLSSIFEASPEIASYLCCSTPIS